MSSNLKYSAVNFILSCVCIVGASSTASSIAEPIDRFSRKQELLSNNFREDMKRTRDKMNSLGTRLDSEFFSKPAPTADERDAASESILHFRGKGGIPFPEQAMLVLPQGSVTSDEEWHQMALAVQAHEKSRPRPQFYKPPRCTGSSIKAKQQNSGGVSGHVYIDRVYLPLDKMPADPEDVLGTGVSIESYAESGDTFAYRSMETSQVKCLPYRIRIVGDREYRYEGLAALKTIDEFTDPKRPTKVHPWVRDTFPGLQ